MGYLDLFLGDVCSINLLYYHKKEKRKETIIQGIKIIIKKTFRQ